MKSTILCAPWIVTKKSHSDRKIEELERQTQEDAEQIETLLERIRTLEGENEGLMTQWRAKWHAKMSLQTE